jgi:DNA-binding beta-propeller fold protein YncE
MLISQNTGTFLITWGSPGSGDGQFNSPVGVAVDGSGNVFVADTSPPASETNNSRIQEFTNTGTFVRTWGCPGTGDGQFNEPSGVAVDASGNVFVTDHNNSRSQKFACP